MNENKIGEILRKIGLGQTPESVVQLQHEEDGEYYNVWRITVPGETLILKQAKGYELETYQTFFSEPQSYAPRLLGSANWDGEDYLLTEYIPGRSLMKCDRESLNRTLDSLIAMQESHWNDRSHQNCGQSYSRSLTGRQNRRNYLLDPQLEAAYDAYLRDFTSLPRTLCHDDLLPFNVVVSAERAVFIDWEYGGILPYPTSLARLIAHAEANEDAFFYMTEEDKSFAVDYYFRNFVRQKGISYERYLHSIQLFVFYEFCEWVYVGNKYGDITSQRFRSYHKKAKELASILTNYKKESD